MVMGGASPKVGIIDKAVRGKASDGDLLATCDGSLSEDMCQRSDKRSGHTCDYKGGQGPRVAIDEAVRVMSGGWKDGRSKTGASAARRAGGL